MNTAEKIETIVLARSSGTLGKFTEYSPGKFRVQTDGLCVLARVDELGWHVCFRGVEAIDADLYGAVTLALACGKDAADATRFDIAGHIASWS